MIGDVSHAKHIYIVCGYTDMRKAIDGLAAIVQQNFGLDVFSGSLFLFCGKRCDRIKALIWEEDGFVLLIGCNVVQKCALFLNRKSVAMSLFPLMALFNFHHNSIRWVKADIPISYCKGKCRVN